MSLKSTIEDNTTVAGRAFDLCMQLVIVVCLVSFSIGTLPDLESGTRSALDFIEIGCIGIFSVEYLLRLFVATKRLGFIFSFFGLVDLVAILPFYLVSGLNLGSLRAFRLLRLFRVFKLFRFNSAIRRFHRAFVIAREELILFVCVTFLLLFFAGTGIYYCENKVQPEAFSSVFAGLWWAVVTLTTVGYGDIVPVTVGGRCFTFIILMLGLGIVAVPTGLIASALSQARDEEAVRNQK